VSGYRHIKRGLDVIISGALLAVTSPLMLIVGALIKRHDGGDVLYRATRVGRDGDEFTMFKFRTMVVDAERLGGSSTASNDARITPVGRWLRDHKLDELPQLLNVLRGDMSLVGPRPQVAWDVDRYTPAERRLLSVAPGITDWASIRFRDEGEILARESDPDEAYDRLIRPEKIRLGLEYVDRVSWRTDLAILGQTLRVVWSRDSEGKLPGQPSEAQVPDFARITEDWATPADPQQWELARSRFSLCAALAGGGDVLEVGCGTGFGLEAIAPFASRCVGVEIDKKNVATAAARARHCLIVRGDAAQLPFRAESFDCVVALEMLYYLTDQQQFLADVRRLVRQGGRVLVTLPNASRSRFSPSPFSTSYPDVDHLRSMMQRTGLDVQIYGGLPAHDLASRRERLRKILVALHLVPRTISGRARLKSLVHRQMSPLHTIDVDPQRAFDGLFLVHDAQEAERFAILVAVGVVGGSSASTARSQAQRVPV
jgi:lipopolysaccharide/colanic/teichoic acid biosynthesis glycosyltransferase/SAM-dependent methyltransferase